jgi:hypothetical protein
LSPEWEPRHHQEEFITRSIRVAERNEHGQAVGWFTDGLRSLQASGLIEEAATTPEQKPPADEPV